VSLLAFNINFVFSGDRAPERIECTSAVIEVGRQPMPRLPSLDAAVPSDRVIPAPSDSGDDQWDDGEDV
jgi:hypothetical protein